MKNFVKALLIAIIGNAVNKLLSGGERRNYKQGNQPVKKGGKAHKFSAFPLFAI